MIAYFDCFSGISGDMALGALLDCGVPLDALKHGLSSLQVSGWDIEATAVLQSGIHALDVRITLDGLSDEQEMAAADRAEHGHRDDHRHHAHEHKHGEHEHDHHDHTHGEHENEPHDHAHSHDHARAEGHGAPAHFHGRSMAKIRALIEASALSPAVQRTSLDIFSRIAVAEAHLHHSTPDAVHFHEIGGIDSLLDICGVAWCLEYLGIDEVYCSALPYSTGFVDCAHGRMPVPAPATLELLKGAAMIPAGAQGEMVTPTGAGIIAALAREFGPPPPMTPLRIGSGSGKKRFADRPNMLRVVLAETAAMAPVAAEPLLRGLNWSTLTVVECNIDNMNPELYAHVMDGLFAAGALDVWLQPIQMKKNRPAVTLGALCENEVQGKIIKELLVQTPTLGVRTHQVQRAALPREQFVVQTGYGNVRVKAAAWPEGGLWRAAPESDDVKRLAAEQKVPALEIYQAALRAAEQHKNATETIQN